MSKEKPIKHRESLSRKVFVACNYILCLLFGPICLLPMLHILAVSLSSKLAVFSGNVVFAPVDFTLDNYRFVMRDSQFFHAYGVTVLRTALGWAVSIVLLVLAAYPLSLPQSRFGAKNLFTWYFVVIMLFGGGMIPTYLVVNATGLIDTIWALVIPGGVSTYNLLVLRTAFLGIPAAMEESARLDGANDLLIYVRIVLPLSKPLLATLALFVAVGQWNSWMDTAFYCTGQNNLRTLAFLLRDVIVSNETGAMRMQSMTSVAAGKMKPTTSRSIQMAAMIVSVLPILCVYPFLQKYFVSGIMLGAVKG